MKLSKTKFIHYMNSKHRINFEKTYNRKVDEGTLTDDDLFELLELEKNAKKHILLSALQDILIESSDDEELEIDVGKLALKDPQLEVMMPYYEKIEALSERKIKNTFGGQVTYSKETFSQKYFQIEENGYYFFAFLDAYQEDEKTVRVIETKATTSNKFNKMQFRDDDKTKQPIFIESPDGILFLREELGLSVNAAYHKKVNSLFNRTSDVGKYVYDLAYQRYIIEKADLKIKPHRYYLSVLNREYIFDGKYDDNNEPIYTDDIMVFIDLTRITQMYLKIFENDFKSVIFKLDHMDDEAIRLEEQLLKANKLLPFKYEELMDIEYPVTEFYLSHHGFTDGDEKYKIDDLIEMKKLSMYDLPYEWLTKKNHLIQYQALHQEVPVVNEKKIKAVLEYLRYPLYHLDFETFPCPLPRYKGERPYDQSVFQFSIHIERKSGICDKDKDHYEFLAPDHADYREEIARLLTTIIKDDDGHIIAYNYTFEKSRMKELAKIFPAYSRKLLNLVDRTFDLRDILKGNSKLFGALGFEEELIFNFYHKDLHGSYSIKKVLPVLSDLTYKGLPIGNGTDALVTYAKFPQIKEKNLDDYHQKYRDLLAYCKQDTWAMVIILNELRKYV